MSLANSTARKSFLTKALVAGAAAIGTLALGGTAMAQAVVIRSTGPSAAQYPMGRKLPANATVSLRAGDHVTVLDKSGTRVLSGPGSFVMNGAINRNGSSNSVLASVMEGGASRVRTRTGAVRGGFEAQAKPAGPDSIWYVDVSKGGTYCVADPSQLVLWRPSHAEQATGKLTSADGTVADVTWNRDNSLKLWPSATLPVVDGQTYTFSDPVGPPVKITTRLMKSVPADDLDMAAMLGQMGCSAQLDVMAKAAAAPGSAGE